jgi:hypothetical protein
MGGTLSEHAKSQDEDEGRKSGERVKRGYDLDGLHDGNQQEVNVGVATELQEE